jgi:ADP-heptose:LPS heptosyltransferase
MAHRFATRLRTLVRATLASLAPRRQPEHHEVSRVLVAHNLLLGDTFMLTPLLAKLRQSFPAAEIVMTVQPAILPLYAGRPYGVRALAFDPRQPDTLDGLLSVRGYELAFVPGDNRYSWLARALGARWVVAFAGDRPAYKNWPVDELRPYPSGPAVWGDMVAGLIEGPEPVPYSTRAWPAPTFKPYALPPDPYAVLHVGASSSLKFWPAQRWRDLAQWLVGLGVTPVWSGGHQERHLVENIDPESRHPNFAGRLDLAQMWQLVAKSIVLICPDTGVAHLGRLTGTPTVALFGPGSHVICGAGRFWRNAPYSAVAVDPFPCRDQQILFRRKIAWVRRCGRGSSECNLPRCMEAITADAVRQAILGVVPTIRTACRND